MDQLEATHQRGHKDARYFWIPEQVQDKDFSTNKEKNCAKYWKDILQGNRSLQDESVTPMMDGTENPIRIQRLEVRVCADTTQRELPAQKQKQTVADVDREHRHGRTN